MAATAARSVLRVSSSLRGVAPRVSAGARSAARTPLRLPGLRPPVARFLRRAPVEASFCVESLMPMHSATAAALMTSMLSVSLRGYGWLSEAGSDDV